MRLVVLCQDPDGPVARHRVLAIAPHLGVAGFTDVQILAIPKRVRDRVSLFGTLRDADAVLLLRKLFTVAELRLLRHAARRLVFDLDDAIMYRDPFRGNTRSHVRSRRFRAVVRAADMVLAGNTYLAAHARGAAETEVVLARTPIDTTRFCPAAASESEQEMRTTGFRVGWVGSGSTRPYLSGIDRALARAAEAVPGLRLAVMADCAPDVSVPVDFTPWSGDAEVAFLRSLDVGVMPLSDDAWSRGKCGFKLLQYMACGVASVASPVGVNVRIANAGQAALLAIDEDQWTEALTALACDPVRRAALAAAGRARVVAAYSTDVVGPQTAAHLARCARAGVSG